MAMETMNAPLGRRGFLGGVAVAGGALLAGCSGGSNPSSSQAGGTGGKGKKGGTLRHAPAGFNEATDLDPHSASSVAAIKRAAFDALITTDHNAKEVLGLAEVFEPKGKDMATWTIRVRDGVEFHNGKTLGADDVIFTIKRLLDPKDPKAASTLLGAIDLNNMKTMDKRTVRLKLKSPNSRLSSGFTPSYSAVVPVDFDPKKPIGTGPFSTRSFNPRQRWIGDANKNYWGKGPFLDRVELFGFADTTAALNAILGGQVDSIDHLLPSQLPQVKSRESLVIIESETGQIQQIGMNCRKGQDFEDPRVRKAFKLMLDREHLVKTVYAGYGEPGNDVGCFPHWDESVDPKLKAEQDLDKAKALLEAAGKDGMSTTLRVGEVVPGMKAAAQLVVQQAKKIGVTVRLDNVSDIASYYNDAYFAAQLGSDQTTTLDMYSGAMYYWLKGAGYNSTGYTNPKVESLFKSAVTQDGDAYDATMRKMSDIIADDGPWLVWGRQNLLGAYSNKFTGVHKDASGNGLNGCWFQEMSLA